MFELNTVKEFKDKLLQLSREELLDLIAIQDPEYIDQINQIEKVFREDLTHLNWPDGTPIEGRDFTVEELAVLIDPPFLFDRELAKEYKLNEESQRQIHIASDPVLWMKYYLKTRPRVYQVLFLRETNVRRILRMGRRSGKTSSISMFLLWYAYTHVDGKCIIMAPTKGQAGLIYEELLKYIGESAIIQDSVERKVMTPQYEIALRNGSTLRFFTTGMRSGQKADGVRGQEAHIIVLDEMELMGPDDLVSIIPMLTKTDKYQEDKVLIAASTPTGQRAKFWEWNNDPKYKAFWYPSQCFIPGTKITMGDGTVKNIEDIHIGDIVYTELGPQEVLNTFASQYKGELNHIMWYGNSDGIFATPNHPFASSKSKRRQKDYNWKWIDSSDIKPRLKRNLNSGSLLRAPIFKDINEISIDLLECNSNLYEYVPGRVKLKRVFKAGVGQDFKNDMPRYIDAKSISFAKLAGWYLAEGNLDRKSDIYDCYQTVDWTLNINELVFIQEILNCLNELGAGNAIVTERKSDNACKISISNTPLAILLEKVCGRDSDKKQLSSFIMTASHSFQEAFIEAYLNGDGYVKTPNNIVASTVSEILAKQIQMIGARLTGFYPSISKGVEGFRQINPKYNAYKTKPYWTIQYNKDIRANLGKKKISQDDYAILVKSNTKVEYEGYVFNFEVANTNSYIANGLLVHNCNPNWDQTQEDLFRDELTETAYRHEIDADYGEDAQGVYPHKYVDLAFLHPGWDYKADIDDPNSFYVMGVDWDKYASDGGVNFVILQYCGADHHDERLAGRTRVAYREEISKDEYLLHKAVDRIVILNSIFKPVHIYVDKGYGEMQVEHLHLYGKKHPETRLHQIVKSFSFSETLEILDPFTGQVVKKEIKPFMVENLRYMLEKQSIVFSSHDEDLYMQLISYIVTNTGITGRPQFGMSGSVPDHAHDALILACLAISQNYGELMNPSYAVRGRAIRNDVFLPMFKVENKEDEMVAKEVWGDDLNKAPIYRRRAMAYNSRGNNKAPIKRKMF